MISLFRKEKRKLSIFYLLFKRSKFKQAPPKLQNFSKRSFFFLSFFHFNLNMKQLEFISKFCGYMEHRTHSTNFNDLSQLILYLRNHTMTQYIHLLIICVGMYLDKETKAEFLFILKQSKILIVWGGSWSLWTIKNVSLLHILIDEQTRILSQLMLIYHPNVLNAAKIQERFI